MCCASSCSCGLPCTKAGVAPGLPLGSGTLDEIGFGVGVAAALTEGLADAAAPLAAGLAEAPPLAAALGLALAAVEPAALVAVDGLAAAALLPGTLLGLVGAALPPQAAKVAAAAIAPAKFAKVCFGLLGRVTSA